MIISTLPQMTPEQARRQELQVQWLISALRRMTEPHQYLHDERTSAVHDSCPMCGAAFPAGKYAAN